MNAGAMSGLTLGLLSLSKLDLEVLRRSGTAAEKRLATKLIPVRGYSASSRFRSFLRLCKGFPHHFCLHRTASSCAHYTV